MRIRTSIAAALVAVALAAPAAAAAPPGVPNDEPGGAIGVTSIPFSNTQSTSKATAGTGDAGCGAGGLDQATVWYSLTLAANTRVLVDTAGSSYGTGVNVFAAGPNSEILTCSGGAAIFDAVAGQTYSILIADIDGGRNGGRLVVSIGEGPPPLALGLALDPDVTFDSATGTVGVSGTTTCSVTTDFLDINVEVSQTTGRFTNRGFGGTSVACAPGETVAWSVDVVGETEPLKPGSAQINASAFGCEFFSCDEATATMSVRIPR